MEASVESIPKQETNATREYLAKYISYYLCEEPLLYENSRLLVPQILG